MQKQPLYDITQVCKMMKITSRTLRYYEEKGMIQSTTVGLSQRRQYTEEQISHIRRVLALRTLGLPVKSIVALQQKNADLKQEILSRRAEIYASIHTKICEINRLNDALVALEIGESIYSAPSPIQPQEETAEQRLVKICANAIVHHDTSALYRYFSADLSRSLPQNIYENARTETLVPLGAFRSFEDAYADPHHPGVWIQLVAYDKLGLKITLAFSNQKITGLWLGYYDTNRRNLL